MKRKISNERYLTLTNNTDFKIYVIKFRLSKFKKLININTKIKMPCLSLLDKIIKTWSLKLIQKLGPTNVTYWSHKFL